MHHEVWQLGHLWSLGAEEQFYLIWPVALLLLFRYRAFACVVLIVAGALSRTYGSLSQLYSFPAVMDSMAIGCLLAIY